MLKRPLTRVTSTLIRKLRFRPNDIRTAAEQLGRIREMTAVLERKRRAIVSDAAGVIMITHDAATRGYAPRSVWPTVTENSNAVSPANPVSIVRSMLDLAAASPVERFATNIP